MSEKQETLEDVIKELMTAPHNEMKLTMFKILTPQLNKELLDFMSSRKMKDEKDGKPVEVPASLFVFMVMATSTFLAEFHHGICMQQRVEKLRASLFEKDKREQSQEKPPVPQDKPFLVVPSKQEVH